MPKPMYVWSGSAWVSVASEVESLATYATQSYADNTPAARMIVPSSVAVGSGSGSVGTSGAVTFSGASSVSINDVFSSSYDNYKIVARYTAASAAVESNFRLRVSGADSSANNYAQRTLYYYSGTVAAWKNATNTFSDMGTHSTTATLLEINASLPFGTNRTAVRHDVIEPSQLTTGGFIFSDTTSFTGFTIYPTSGTITGTIRVYGLKN